MAKSYQHTRKKKEYAAIEIEKLKAEILKLQPKQSEDFYSCKRKVFDILNNRISELKGVSNE